MTDHYRLMNTGLAVNDVFFLLFLFFSFLSFFFLLKNDKVIRVPFRDEIPRGHGRKSSNDDHD